MAKRERPLQTIGSQMSLKYYHLELKLMGCVVCQNAVDTHIHHVLSGSIAKVGIDKGLALKVSGWLVLPLCANHHTGRCGIHLIGIEKWENRFNTQLHYLKTLNNLFSINVFERAGYSYDSKLDRYYKNH